MGRFLGEPLFGNLIRPIGPPYGAAARPTLKMIHWIIFQALRPPLRGEGLERFPQTPSEKAIRGTIQL